MKHPILLVLAASLSCLGACVADSAGPVDLNSGATVSGKADTHGATVHFRADYEELVDGEIVGGEPLLIRYDLERLAACKHGGRGDFPGYMITGFYSVDGGEAVQFDAASQVAGETELKPRDATIDVPAGRELQIWFRVNNISGCVAYDSDFGANYRFAIAGDATPPAPEFSRLHFAEDFSESLEGAVTAGGLLSVSFDLDRLTDCFHGGRNGYLGYMITGFYSVDGAEAVQFPVSRSELGASELIPTDWVFRVPAGEEIQFWFQVSNMSGCVAYDSNMSANYRFAID